MLPIGLIGAIPVLEHDLIVVSADDKLYDSTTVPPTTSTSTDSPAAFVRGGGDVVSFSINNSQDYFGTRSDLEHLLAPGQREHVGYVLVITLFARHKHRRQLLQILHVGVLRLCENRIDPFRTVTGTKLMNGVIPGRGVENVDPVFPSNGREWSTRGSGYGGKDRGFEIAIQMDETLCRVLEEDVGAKLAIQAGRDLTLSEDLLLYGQVVFGPFFLVVVVMRSADCGRCSDVEHAAFGGREYSSCGAVGADGGGDECLIYEGTISPFFTDERGSFDVEEGNSVSGGVWSSTICEEVASEFLKFGHDGR